MSVEDKFRAAVNVIRSLPKNGSYQPSHEMMLRFYGYFKQASEGPCNCPRPSFWEVVNKMKWDAWNKLGNMSKHEAMSNYVSELTKIVETMSYTDNVADFMGSLGSFYETVPMEDLELLLGNVIERVRSQPGSPLSSSPFGSREASPQRASEQAKVNGRAHGSSLETSPASSYSASPAPPEQDDDEDDDEFADTVETAPERIVHPKKARGLTNGDVPNGHAVNGHAEETTADRGRTRERSSPLMPRARMNQDSDSRGQQRSRGDITEQIRETVLHLQRDLDRVTSRVRSLEVSAIPSARHTPRASRWPGSELSASTLALLLAWPVVVHLVAAYIRRRRNT